MLSGNKPLFSAGIILLEVLVSISILAICIIAIFEVFISCFDAQLRSENYTKATVIAMDLLEYGEEFPDAESEGELDEDGRIFKWECVRNDIEGYPSLREIVMNMRWKQGKRQGGFSLTRYVRNRNK